MCKRPDDGLQLQLKHVAVNNWCVTVAILAICYHQRGCLMSQIKQYQPSKLDADVDGTRRETKRGD